MKSIGKKVAATFVLLVLTFSTTQISYSFEHMDVCNYTFGDTSGDYYDRLCTEDGKPSEEMNRYSSNVNTSDSTTDVKEEKIHDLRYVDHRTRSSFPFGSSNYDTNKEKEIAELKNQLLQNKLLLEEYKNNELVKKQKDLLDENKRQASLLEESKINTKATSAKKTIIYGNTPMEDTVVNQATLDLIRERIERHNLRNSMK